MKCPKCNNEYLELIANVCTTMKLSPDGEVSVKYPKLSSEELMENIDDKKMEVYCPECGESFHADFDNAGALVIGSSMNNNMSDKKCTIPEVTVQCSFGLDCCCHYCKENRANGGQCDDCCDESPAECGYYD